MKKGFTFFVAISICFVFSSCSTSISATEEMKVPSSNVNPNKQEAIAALLPESIRNSGVLKVASETKFAPAEFIADDDKTPVGYDIEMARAIAHVLGLKVEIHQATFDSIIPAVGAKYDIAMAGFTVSQSRLEVVDFIANYRSGLAWAVRSDSALANVNLGDEPEKACGEKIGVQTGSFGEEIADSINEECEENGKPMEILRWDAASDAMTAVIGKKVDAVLTDSQVVGYAARNSSGVISQAGSVTEWSYQGIAVSKSDPELKEAVRAAMQFLILSGYYEKILRFYGAQEGGLNDPLVDFKFDEDGNALEVQNNVMQPIANLDEQIEKYDSGYIELPNGDNEETENGGTK